MVSTATYTWHSIKINCLENQHTIYVEETFESGTLKCFGIGNVSFGTWNRYERNIFFGTFATKNSRQNRCEVNIYILMLCLSVIFLILNCGQQMRN